MNKFAKKFIEYFFYGNIYVGILAAGLTWVNSVYFKTINYRIILFNFFSAVLVYNLDRLFMFSSDYENSPDRTQFILKNAGVIRFSVLISFLGILFLFPTFSLEFYLIIGALGFITILYLILFNYKFLFPRKKLAIFKPVLLGLVWTLATLFLPIAAHLKHTAATNWILLAIIRFIEYFANGLFFDYRDRFGDEKKGKINIFNQWTPQFILSSLIILLTVCLLFLFYGLLTKTFPVTLYADLIILIFFIFVSLVFLREKSQCYLKIATNAFFYMFALDGILFLPVIFTVIFTFNNQ